jgi:hypothetical protein
MNSSRPDKACRVCYANRVSWEITTLASVLASVEGRGTTMASSVHDGGYCCLSIVAGLSMGKAGGPPFAGVAGLLIDRGGGPPSFS